MLRKIRITLAVLCFVPVTLLFLDFTGTIHAWFGWLAKIQFLPAVLALNLGVVAALVLLTLLLGRVYCSVVCPLGVMQDVFGRLGRRHRKNRYSHSPALSWLRYTVLSLFVVALAAGVGSVVALLDPYGAYGRIASNLFAPLWQWGNNLLAGFAERAGSYAFYRTDVWIKSLPTFAIAVAMFAALAVLSWRNGRTYCNTICPVGSFPAFRCCGRSSTLRNATVADNAPAGARRRVSTAGSIRSIIRAVSPAWIASINAGAERSGTSAVGVRPYRSRTAAGRPIPPEGVF